MAKDKPKTKKFGMDKKVEIKSPGSLASVDEYGCRFNIDPDEKLKSKASFILTRDCLPADYEPERYDVTAEMVIKVEAKAKDMPIN